MTLPSWYSHDDCLTTIALLGLLACALRSANVDLSAFGMGVGAIFTGHAARSFGNAKENPE